jgi:CheY-like chemotaxis protein
MMAHGMGRVLIVEDHVPTSRGLAAIVRHMGHEGTVANTGNAAVVAALSGKPDLVLLDVMLPDIDGVEVLRRFRSHPRTSKLRVIFYTASNDPQVRVSAKDLGALDVWEKSRVLPQEIERRLSEHLGKQTSN